jgi:hypothetical protein
MLLAYPESQRTKFHAAGWTCWFYFLLLESCICPDAISRWIRQRNSIKFCAILWKIVTDTLSIIRQAFGDESMSRTQKVETHRDRKRRDRWRAISRECSSFSFTSKGVVHKELVLAAQTLNSAYYCDVLRQLLENVQRLRLELLVTKDLAVASQQRTVSQFLFHKWIFDQTKLLSSPTHPTSLCFPDWK